MGCNRKDVLIESTLVLVNCHHLLLPLDVASTIQMIRPLGSIKPLTCCNIAVEKKPTDAWGQKIRSVVPSQFLGPAWSGHPFRGISMTTNTPPFFLCQFSLTRELISGAFETSWLGILCRSHLKLQRRTVRTVAITQDATGVHQEHPTRNLSFHPVTSPVASCPLNSPQLSKIALTLNTLGQSAFDSPVIWYGASRRR